VVDKGSSDNLVSFCGQGVRKISPTQFELRASQFTPTGNLYILVLRPVHDDTNNVPPQAVDTDAQDDLNELNCDQLWYRRNSVFKAARYCFHTPKAIRVFGNAGCAVDNERDVPLSDRDREALFAIQQIERLKRCSQ
jgi:hypothetical protein